MQIVSQNITSTPSILSTTARHFTENTLNNFYDQHVLTPRNNKRRIICIAGTSTVFVNCQFTSRRCIAIHKAVFTGLGCWVYQKMKMSNTGFEQIIIKSIQMSTSFVLQTSHKTTRPSLTSTDVQMT